MIPSRAIRTVNRQRVVTVQTAPGIYKQVAVQVGLANDTQTEITSGLNEGDVVVINTLPASRPASGGGPGVLFRGGG